MVEGQEHLLLRVPRHVGLEALQAGRVLEAGTSVLHEALEPMRDGARIGFVDDQSKLMLGDEVAHVAQPAHTDGHSCHHRIEELVGQCEVVGPTDVRYGNDRGVRRGEGGRHVWRWYGAEEVQPVTDPEPRGELQEGGFVGRLARPQHADVVMIGQMDERRHELLVAAPEEHPTHVDREPLLAVQPGERAQIERRLKLPRLERGAVEDHHWVSYPIGPGKVVRDEGRDGDDTITGPDAQQLDRSGHEALVSSPFLVAVQLEFVGVVDQGGGVAPLVAPARKKGVEVVRMHDLG